MALKIEKGVLTEPGSTGNQTVNLIDSAFGIVKALIVWMDYSATESDVSGNATWSMGLASYRGATAQQWRTSFIDVNGAATMQVVGGHDTASLLHNYASLTPTTDFDVVFVSLGDAQFVINWTKLAGTASLKVHYLALGGDDITDALVSSFDLATGAGTQDVTVASGFGKPDLIICHAAIANATNGDAERTTNVAFGVGSDDANEQHSTYLMMDATANAQLASHQKATLLALMTNDTTLAYEIELSPRANWPTDGFEVNKLTAPGASCRIGYLALKGSFTSVIGSATVPTAAPTVVQDYIVGQAPKGAIFFHNAIPANASIDNSHADLGCFGFGASDGTREGWVGNGDDDANTTSVAHRHHSESKSIRMFTPSASGTLTSEADASFVGTRVRLTWADTDTVAREYSYLLLGDALPTYAGSGRFEHPGQPHELLRRRYQTPASLLGTPAAPAIEKTGALFASGLLSGEDAFTPAETGSLTGGAEVSGTDVFTPSETGALMATGFLAGTELIVTFTKTGSLFAQGLLSGADTFQPSETGSLVATGRLSGADGFAPAETGTVAASGLVSAADVFQASEAGTLMATGLISGPYAKVVGGKAGSVISGALTSGADVFTASETGSVSPRGFVSGADAFTDTETGSLLTQALLTGGDAATFAETGALIVTSRLTGYTTPASVKANVRAADAPLFDVLTSTGLVTDARATDTARTGVTTTTS